MLKGLRRIVGYFSRSKLSFAKIRFGEDALDEARTRTRKFLV